MGLTEKQLEDWCVAAGVRVEPWQVQVMLGALRRGRMKVGRMARAAAPLPVARGVRGTAPTLAVLDEMRAVHPIDA